MLSDKHLRSEWERFKRGQGWEPERSAASWLAEFKAEVERVRSLRDEEFATPAQQAKLWSASMVGSAGAGERVDTEPLHGDAGTVELLNQLRTRAWPNERRRLHALRDCFERVRERMNALTFPGSRHPLAKLRRIFALLKPADATCVFSEERNRALSRLLVPRARGTYPEHCVRARGRLRELLGPEASLDEEIERALFLHWLRRQPGSAGARRGQTRSWLSRVQLLDDAPITRLDEDEDLLGFSEQVEMIAATLARAKGPMVIHVDGAWGRGKSSFCRMLDERLRGVTRELDAAVEAISSSWFVASDRGADVTDGVLHAVARAVTDDDPEETLRILRTWGRDPDARRGAVAGELVARMSQLRTWVEHELGWRDERGDAELVTIELAGERLQLRRRCVDRRLAVIFVDDLDRCTPENARAVMDSIQQFVGFRGLAFVIAADRAVLDVAFAASVRDYVGVERLGPSQALEKYIRHRVQLPGISKLVRSRALNHRLVALQAKLMPGGQNLLVGPGAWLAQGVAVLLARSFPATMTMRRLKRILNELVTTLAMAADSCRLSTELLTPSEKTKTAPLWEYRADAPRERPRFDTLPPSSPEDFKDYFLGQLAVVTARHVWPSLYALYTRDVARFANVISALTAAGEGLNRWPESVLREVIEQVIAAEAGEQTPFESKKEMCAFLFHGLRSSDPPRGVRTVMVDMSAAAEDLGAAIPQASRAEQAADQQVSFDDEDAALDDTTLDDASLESSPVERAPRRRRAQTRSLPQSADAPLVFSMPDAGAAAQGSKRAAEAATRGVPSPTPSSAAPEPTVRAGLARAPSPLAGAAPRAPTRSAPSLDHAPVSRSLESGQDARGEFEIKLARLAARRERLGPDAVARLLGEFDELLGGDADASWVHRASEQLAPIVAGSDWSEQRARISKLLRALGGRAVGVSLDAGHLLRVLFDARHSATSPSEAFGFWSPYVAWAATCWPMTVDLRSEFRLLIEELHRTSTASWPPRERRAVLAFLDVLNTPLASELLRDVVNISRWIRREFLEDSAALVSDSPPVLETSILFRCARYLEAPFPEPLLTKIGALIDRADGASLTLEFRELAAGVFAESDDLAHKRRALGLLWAPEGTRRWTPEALHVAAQLHIDLEQNTERAGRLWELAYRAGLRDPAMQRAFSLYLDGKRMKDIAVRVTRGTKLPPESEWQPFGDTPALADVVVTNPETEAPA